MSEINKSASLITTVRSFIIEVQGSKENFLFELFPLADVIKLVVNNFTFFD